MSDAGEVAEDRAEDREEEIRMDQMQDLAESRRRIDEIDARIVELYEERLAISGDVAEYKIANHRPVLDKRREEEKLTRLEAMAGDAFSKQGIRELFEQIMSVSRKKQYRLLAAHGMSEDLGFYEIDDYNFPSARVVYQGVRGAYSQAACKAFFRDGCKSMDPVETWRDAMEAISNGEADYAVLPVENSTAGIVSENYDLLMEYQAVIVGEQIIQIDHALLGLAGAKIGQIKRVYSHPQALAQCEGYLRNIHPDFEAFSLKNTAMAARKVMEDRDPSQAAIAGSINAQIYGLSVLDQAIQDVKGNETRFIVISPKREYTGRAGNISIAFSLPNESGSLYRILSHFIFNGLSMTRIESRPLRGKKWEYIFFIDFEGNLREEAVMNCLQGLKEETEEMFILGTY